jgi:hypothetical protein
VRRLPSETLPTRILLTQRHHQDLGTRGFCLFVPHATFDSVASTLITHATWGFCAYVVESWSNTVRDPLATFVANLRKHQSRRDAATLIAGIIGGGTAALLGVPLFNESEAGKRKHNLHANKNKNKNKKHKKNKGNKNQPPGPQSPPPPPPPSAPSPPPPPPVDQSLYPDLQTQLPSDLAFDTEMINGVNTWVLRFSNSVANLGEGRLELQGSTVPQTTPKPVFQNLYDAPTGGNQTSHVEITEDTIYHPTHRHFHFPDFAAYSLLGATGSGFQPTGRVGTKNTFCVMDTDPFDDPEAPNQYGCNQEFQGMSVGWGDTYGSNLADQWVVLGPVDESPDAALPDGEYGLQSTADPQNLINEGGGSRETNNVTITYFTVVSGNITDERSTP